MHSGITPACIMPTNIRRTNDDLPLPGLARTNADGCPISRPRNHATGSQHTVEPSISDLPSGAPTNGDPDPTANGYKPHTWTEVARYSGVTSMIVLCPPPRIAQPRGPGLATGNGAASERCVDSHDDS